MTLEERTTSNSNPGSPIRSSYGSATTFTHNSGTTNAMHCRSSAPSTPNRPRMNSRDIPRSYSGLYGQGGDDLLPFELARNWHTDWLEQGGWLLLFTYIGAIIIVEVSILALLDALMSSNDGKLASQYQFMKTMQYPLLSVSTTLTNALHCLLSIVYLHWLKGSAFDQQGEMAALTLWEQLEGRPNTLVVKRVLTMAPTLVCYAACQFSNYDRNICIANVLLWTIHIFGKLPIMNGVRIFGINRTAGIDDELGGIDPTTPTKKKPKNL